MSFVLLSCKLPVYLRVLTITDNPDSTILLKRYLIKYNVSKKILYKRENNRLIDLAKKGEFDNSVSGYESLLQNETHQPVLYYNLGILYSIIGKSGLAEKTMLKAVKLDPKNQFYKRAYLIIFPNEKL